METMLENIVEIAKKNLVQDKYLSATFILVKGEEFVLPPTPIAMLGKVRATHGYGDLNMEESKTLDTILIGSLAKVYGADRVILIWDAAFRVADPNVPYDETEAPLSYPKSMRTECIMASEVLLPSGQDTVITIPYKGGEGEPVEFVQWEEKIAKAMKEGGKIQSRFTKLILEGYNKAGAIL
ncbi:MAG: hypothetical protein IMZ61_11555 [Planctomycetes bacterium]|nr:hypothetical protein [Planctomycetota bacterium]